MERLNRTCRFTQEDDHLQNNMLEDDLGICDILDASKTRAILRTGDYLSNDVPEAGHGTCDARAC
jgi:hypothetical protein